MRKEAVVSVLVAVNVMSLVFMCGAIESPQYTVVHLESDFEIRLYRDSVWMSAPTRDISFEKASWNGFHRLFQYTLGANLNFSRLAMTTPVLTSVVPGAGPFHSSAYFIRFYLPVKFQADPPLPLPELHIKPSKWNSHCVAVRKFSGYAKDNIIVREAEKLAFSLSRSPWANATSSKSQQAYSIAQYNPPLQIFGRKNEVWVDIDAPELAGCESIGVAAY